MNCPSCGTENIEDAVYCMRCGRRLDGTAECPNCKKRIPAEAEFCIYCGKRVTDGAPSASAAAMLAAETAASAAEPSSEQAAVSVPRSPAEGNAAAGGSAKAARRGLTQKILRTCAASLSLALAAVSFLFVFFIGVSAEIDGTVANTDLYYYFGGAYSDIEGLLNLNKNYTSFFNTALHVQAICGTVLSALTLACVAALAIAGAVYDIRTLTGKSKGGGCLSVYAYLAYLAFAVLFLANNGGSAGTIITAALNGATKAGVALGAVLLAARFGCNLAADPKKCIANGLPVAVLSFCAAAAGCVLLGVASAPLFGLNYDGLAAGSLGPLGLLIFFVMYPADTIGEGTEYSLLALMTVSFLLLCALVLLAAVCIRKGLAGALAEKSRGGVGCAAAVAACAIALLVVSVIGADILVTSLRISGYSATYTVPIALVVFSLILLALQIARAVLSLRHKSQREQTARETAEEGAAQQDEPQEGAADLVQAHLFRSGRKGQKAPSENADGQN